MVTLTERGRPATGSAPLSDADAELVHGFESCSIPADHFHQREYVRIVWIYLTAGSVLGTLERFPAALRRYAQSLGMPELYHETITWALVLLIEERRRRGGELSWEKFSSANEDLFSWPGVLDGYYRAETLAGREAREWFVLPDRLEAEAPDGGCGGAPSGGSG